MSRTVQAAEDVVTLLNSATSGTFSMSFTAVRRYAPVQEAEALTNLDVTVVPISNEDELINRVATSEEHHEVNIAFRKKIRKPENQAEIDPITYAMQETKSYLKRNRDLANGGKLMAIKISPIYDPLHMRDNGVFTGLIVCDYMTAVVAA